MFTPQIYKFALSQLSAALAATSTRYRSPAVMQAVQQVLLFVTIKIAP
jgi:hypothetical protein